MFRLVNFRTFQKSIAVVIGVAALTALGLAPGTAAFAQKAPVEGTDYRVVTPPQPVDTPNKIEVIEFFWYGCPHCNLVEPGFNDWAKRQGANVVVRRIPVAFSNAWMPHQRLYYTLEALGKEGELRPKVFHAIHVDKNLLNTVDSMADWAAKNGIDRTKFIETYNSFSVQAKVQRAAQIARAFGVDSVPTIGIDGKYALNITPESIDKLDYLVSKERALQPAANTAAPSANAPPAVRKPEKKT
jgi:thiol:disulfide interchange protein DsbA